MCTDSVFHEQLRVYYESINREVKIKPIYECRCDERLQTKTKRFTRLSYTGSVVIHLKIKTLRVQDLQVPFRSAQEMRNKRKENSRWEDWHNTKMRRLAPVIEANKVLYIRHHKCLNKLLPSCSTVSVQPPYLLGSERSFCLSVCVVKTKRLTTGNWII
jgi:hypothetical protein